ncbi:MAG: shikimate kinase [Myxococcota bacterium]
MHDYYDPSPRLSLPRPILLAGQIGAGTRLIARSLCARTGLPFVDVDRKIEHEAGASLDQIGNEHGPGRIGHWARQIVERHTIQRPWSIIVLDRAWPSSEIGSLLRRKIDFVHIQRTPDFLLPRIRKEVQAAGPWLVNGLADCLERAEDLKPILDRRTPLLTEAGILLDAGNQHELGVAHIVQDSLESVSQASAF